ncbi:MAG: DUF6938 domain-containing protein [Candidatus Kryptoniota bacterium]
MSNNISSMIKRYVITTGYMGYGHLRAAHNLSMLSGAPVIKADLFPYAAMIDLVLWRFAQYAQNISTHNAESNWRVLFSLFEKALEIPDNSSPKSLAGPKLLKGLSEFGLGKRLTTLISIEEAVVHTFYLPALESVYHRIKARNYLVMCDVDFHPVWVPISPFASSLTYFVPTKKSADRLISYGVPSGNIFITGFPLPAWNVRESIEHFSARKKRLSPNSGYSLTIMYPFSGAGAYQKYFSEFVKAISDELKAGEFRLIVSAGSNQGAFSEARRVIHRNGLDNCSSVHLLYNCDLFSAFSEFNAILPEVDLLITKPSELIFYSGLGIPLLMLSPIGAHEAKNRVYVLENKCGFDMVHLDKFVRCVREFKQSGMLLELAENGYERIPKNGSESINDYVLSSVRI